MKDLRHPVPALRLHWDPGAAVPWPRAQLDPQPFWTYLTCCSHHCDYKDQFLCSSYSTHSNHLLTVHRQCQVYPAPVPPPRPVLTHKLLTFTKFTKFRSGDRIQELPCPQLEHRPPEASPLCLHAEWAEAPSMATAESCHWSANIATTVCLFVPFYCSFRPTSRGKQDPAHTLTYVPGKGSCLRTELKPRWPTAPGTLSPPGWLLQLGLGQLAGVNESHPEVPCKSHLPLASSSMLPSYATWGYGFHSMTTRLNVGCSDRNVALHNQYLKSTTQIYF